MSNHLCKACSPEGYVLSTWALLLKHPNSTMHPATYVETTSNSVYADCETAPAPLLSQAYLLILRRGASSHALFDGVACLPVCVCVAVFQFLKRVHACASSRDGVACLPASHCECVAKSSRYTPKLDSVLSGWLHISHPGTEAWGRSIFQHFSLIAHERQNVEDVRIEIDR